MCSRIRYCGHRLLSFIAGGFLAICWLFTCSLLFHTWAASVLGDTLACCGGLSVTVPVVLLSFLDRGFFGQLLCFFGTPPRHYLPPSLALLLAFTPSSSSGSTAVSCDVKVSSVAIGASSGTFTLPAFVPTFSPVSAITDSNSARFVAPSPLHLLVPVYPVACKALVILDQCLSLR